MSVGYATPVSDPGQRDVDDWLTVAQIAELAGRDRATVIGWIHHGGLPATQTLGSGPWRIARSDWQRWWDTHQGNAPRAYRVLAQHEVDDVRRALGDVDAAQAKLARAEKELDEVTKTRLHPTMRRVHAAHADERGVSTELAHLTGFSRSTVARIVHHGGKGYGR